MAFRVLLVGAEDEENLAIRYIAAVLEKNSFEVRIVPCSRKSEFERVFSEIKKFNPNLAAVSLAFQSLCPRYFELIQKIREHGFKGHLTVGGHFPSFEFKKILETQPGIDSVIRFEGEKPIVALAEALQGKRAFSEVPNLVFREQEKILENSCICEFPNLDELPFPIRKPMQDVRLGEGFATLVASRGCWYSNCLFCCIGAFHSQKKGKRFALRSPESFAEEMAFLYFKRGARLFQFHDDNFMLPTKQESVQRFESMKKAIEKKGIPMEKIAFLVKARPDSLDEKVGRSLKELGVIGIFLGVENASESGLKALQRNTSLEEIKTALNVLRENKMAITYNLLIFHPDAVPKEIGENIDFMKKNLDVAFDFGRAEIVAGSPLEKLAIRENLIDNNWPRPGYKIKNPVVERMFQIHKKTFHAENSPYTAMVHQNIAFSYQLRILQKLHPGRVASEFERDSMQVVSQINEYVAQKVEEMYHLAEQGPGNEKIASFYAELSGTCSGYYKKLLDFGNRMNRLSIAEKVFSKFSVADVLQEKPVFRKILRF